MSVIQDSNAPLAKPCDFSPQKAFTALTTKLKALESQRNSKRSILEALYEDLQKIRSQMATVQQELQKLDDEIDMTERRQQRIMGEMELDKNTDYKDNGCDNDCENIPLEPMMSLQYADNLTQYISKDGQKIRRHESQMDEKTNDENDTAYDRTLADSKEFSLTMHPDEIFTELTQDEFEYESARKRPIIFQEDLPCDEDIECDQEDAAWANSIHSSRRVTLDCKTFNKDMLSDLTLEQTVNMSGTLASDVQSWTHGISNRSLVDLVHKSTTPAGMMLTSNDKNRDEKNCSTLDKYFKAPTSYITADKVNPNYGLKSNEFIEISDAGATSRSASSSSIFPTNLQQRYSAENNVKSHYSKRPLANDHNAAYKISLSSDNFPWSTEVFNCLQNVFKIRSFRDHQKEIINCTMCGDDAFVIMRTGGGKSLTYQIPALLEGRGPQRKVSFVVSPLLSLIRDQEDQMNAFAPGSATSFTSGMSGGNEEQTRRWNMVRDANSGVCLVFVTPERVHKSNKLRSEMEKLHEKGRLGRFVIDECHCACQWGHDFRPDYTKLGILKKHFPGVPLIAVTATASDRVREDCCRLLGVGKNYSLFRSSANRPNLVYSIREKQDGKDAVVYDMATFILQHHRHHAGIIYTLSKKEAEEVAAKLCDFKISARAYHSDVSETAKEVIHNKWMKNKIQVVVATIAFGLGINKPDVRFVLHHSISKTLEAYYQESGRAGRDGGPADCILYYSPKDVSRMLAMIHGQGSEEAFWSMVRYGQEHGNDAMCRQIILATLGEGTIDHTKDARAVDDTVVVRDVTMHAKTVLKLLEWSAKDLTVQQLVQLWRGREAPEFVKNHPPSVDLSKDDCERLIVNLIISDLMAPKFMFSAYNTIVYIQLGPKVSTIANSNAKIVMRFPIRVSTLGKFPTKNVGASEDVSVGSGWITTKKGKESIASKKKCSNSSLKSSRDSVKRSKSVMEKDSVASCSSSKIDSMTKLSIINILDESSDDESDCIGKTRQRGFRKKRKLSGDDKSRTKHKTKNDCCVESEDEKDFK